jgi:hypothetical protein
MSFLKLTNIEDRVQCHYELFHWQGLTLVIDPAFPIELLCGAQFCSKSLSHALICCHPQFEVQDRLVKLPLGLIMPPSSAADFGCCVSTAFNILSNS